jgi:hypothetical protein
MADQDPRDPGESPDSAGQPPDSHLPAGVVPPYGQPGQRSGHGQPVRPRSPEQEWGTGPVGQPPDTDTGRRTGLFLLLAGGLVLIIVIGLLAYSLIDSNGGTDSPEHAVQAFGQAIADRDCPAARDLMTDQAAQSFSCDQIDLSLLPDIQLSLENIRVTDQSDSQATVKADLSALGRSVGMTFSTVLQDGQWLIDNVSVQAGGLTGNLSDG